MNNFRWTFNPAVLTKVATASATGGELNTTMENLSAMQTLALNEDAFTTVTNNFSSPSPLSFAPGDIVQVLANKEQVSILQQGHGEWTEAMLPVRLFKE